MDKNQINIYIKNFKSTICPICKDFYFDKPLNESDIDDYEEGAHCFICGWIYDYNQLLNPNLKTGKNILSINEYNEWYKKELNQDPNFNYFNKYIKANPISHKCPICGEYEFKQELSYDICCICGWQDDGCDILLDGKEQISANSMTYSEYKKQFFKKRKLNPNYKWVEEYKISK